jgi:hypothetical protein
MTMEAISFGDSLSSKNERRNLFFEPLNLGEFGSSMKQ